MLGNRFPLCVVFVALRPRQSTAVVRAAAAATKHAGKHERRCASLVPTFSVDRHNVVDIIFCYLDTNVNANTIFTPTQQQMQHGVSLLCSATPYTGQPTSLLPSGNDWHHVGVV